MALHLGTARYSHRSTESTYIVSSRRELRYVIIERDIILCSTDWEWYIGNLWQAGIESR